jgi:HEAT repeat protein
MSRKIRYVNQSPRRVGAFVRMRRSTFAVVTLAAAIALIRLALAVAAVTEGARQSPTELVSRFHSAQFFFDQFDVAKELVELHDPNVLPSLVADLRNEDRHIRGNAAFVFAGLGDPRGFEVLLSILKDRSDRPPGQGAVYHGGISAPGTTPAYNVKPQITADRYYAAHLLGDLRDPRAVPVLVALLDEPEVNDIVPWSLGQIGDKRAVAPLIQTLANRDPSMRVLAIYGLEQLHATEALPALRRLLDDHQRTTFGNQAPVADAAKAAIAKLELE